jgi:hypothetical protein
MRNSFTRQSCTTDCRCKPPARTSPHQLTIKQVDFLCRLFDLDCHSTMSAYPEFEKVLHKHLKVELGRDPLVVFMLILLLRRFAKAFLFPGNELGRFTGFKFKLEIAKPLPPSPKPRQYNVRNMAEIIKWLERLIALGVYVIASNATAVFLSCIHVVYKQGKKPRPTGDYRLLNLHRDTKDSPDNIHFMERTLSWIVNQHFRYISNMDLNQGFYQCPVDKESQKLLALRTLLGDAIPNTCSMGPKQVPGHFTKVMNHVMGPGNWRGLAAFVDDLHAKGTDAFLQLLWIGFILHCMIKFNMTFDLAKCHWLMEKLTALGFLTGNMTISPDPGKVEALLKLRKPADLNELRSYNSMLTFYSRFFPEYASRFHSLQAPVNAGLEQFFKSNPRKKPLKKDNDVVLPWAHTTSTSTTVKEGSNATIKPLDQISDLVDDVQAARPVAKNKSKKQARYLAKIPVVWTAEMNEAFEYSRTWLSQSPVLVSYCPGYPVVISVDSLLTAQHGIVEQYQPLQNRLALAYYSRKVEGLKKMWSATILELDGLVYVLKKAAHFIEQQSFAVVTDHRAIQFIWNYKGKNRKILERALFLSEFGDRMVIVHKPGYLFLRTDPLSRLVATMFACTAVVIEAPDWIKRIREATKDDDDAAICQRITDLEKDSLPVEASSLVVHGQPAPPPPQC